jgi:hypothetical protein
LKMILENVELWYAHLDPSRPNTRFSKARPSWDVQIRTSDKAQRKEWIASNLKVRDIIPDEDGAAPYFTATLRKKVIKADGSHGEPPEVVDADLNTVDPRTIGNGSRGNVRVFQYEFTRDDGSTGIANVLMGVQLTEHIVYTPKPSRPDDSFSTVAGGTKVVHQEPQEESNSQANATASEPEDDAFKPRSPSPKVDPSRNF